MIEENPERGRSPETKSRTIESIAKIIVEVEPKYRQRIVAIDGGGGAGKTTFARRLQRAIPGSHIVKIDDFYRPPQLRVPLESTRVINPNIDWDRFRVSVLEAVRGNREIRYQLYDFARGTLSGEFVTVPPDATIIVEGVWSLQDALVGYYDYRIWLDAPADVRLERGIARDGEKLRQVWEDEWIPIDEHYRRTSQPQLRADLVVDSARTDYSKDEIVLK